MLSKITIDRYKGKLWYLECEFPHDNQEQIHFPIPNSRLQNTTFTTGIEFNLSC